MFGIPASIAYNGTFMKRTTLTFRQTVQIYSIVFFDGVTVSKDIGAWHYPGSVPETGGASR